LAITVEAEQTMNHYARKACLGLAIGCYGLAGCGEAETPPPAKTDAPKPAVAEAPSAKVKGKGKGKREADPTADMGIKEIREYKRKQMEASGKTP
jgi:hypothetical protein